MGTRNFNTPSDSRAMDHPHACGDKHDRHDRKHRHTGSSPRVWGQVKTYPSTASTAGIIPTRVGTSCSSQPSRWLCTDHPHACGDKQNLLHIFLPKQGSSPRVWGQDMAYLRLSKRIGIIPTRVGTSIFSFAYIHMA